MRLRSVSSALASSHRSSKKSSSASRSSRASHGSANWPASPCPLPLSLARLQSWNTRRPGRLAGVRSRPSRGSPRSRRPSLGGLRELPGPFWKRDAPFVVTFRLTLTSANGSRDPDKVFVRLVASGFRQHWKLEFGGMQKFGELSIGKPIRAQGEALPVGAHGHPRDRRCCP